MLVTVVQTDAQYQQSIPGELTKSRGTPGLVFSHLPMLLRGPAFAPVCKTRLLAGFPWWLRQELCLETVDFSCRNWKKRCVQNLSSKVVALEVHLYTLPKTWSFQRASREEVYFAGVAMLVAQCATPYLQKNKCSVKKFFLHCHVTSL